MNTLFNMPEVQSGVIPFTVALVFALLLGKARPAWASAGIVPGFLLSAFLINGVDITPLTATRKIILLAALSLPVAIVLQLWSLRHAMRYPLLIGLSVCSALWLAWPVINRIDDLISWLPVILGLGYIAAQVVLFDRLSPSRYASTTSLIALGMGTGASAIFAASALYGQLSLSAANAVGAILIMSFFSTIKGGSLLTFPSSLILAMLGFATMLFAELPWYTLVLLGLVPVTAYFGSWRNKTDFTGALLTLSIAMLPALAAIASVWLTVEDSGY